jgi:predicted ribosomally synthesized peptide with SipW-like signal peptide
MKTKNKALLLSLCAVLLVAASVMGTMAYLTSQDAVVNTFSVGSVAITLDEADVDDSDKDDNKTERDKANSYKLLPGHQYDKDPIVHVDSKSEDCYLFVIVKNEIADIEDDVTVANQMVNEHGWEVVGETADGILYVYADEASAPLAVSGGSNITVFKTFKIKGSVENDKLDTYAGKTITVTAYAVQKDGFENKTASVIWNTAFGTLALQN